MATVPQKEQADTEAPLKSDPQLQVRALESGTVIDHLVSGTALRTLRLLNLDRDATVLVGVHLPSSKAGNKDLIKVEGRELTPEEISIVGLLSPRATFSIIRDYRVVNKFSAEVPDEVVGLVRCVNPECISQDDRVASRVVVERREPLKLRCYYCERSFRREELDFY